MADRTPFAGFTHLDPSDPLSADGFGLQDRNTRLMDYFVRLLFTAKHDEHPALTDPTLDPVATITTDGHIPADLALSVGYTLIDADGGETVLSPLVVVNTTPSLQPPDDSPSLAYFTGTGTLLSGSYAYAVTLTDGAGGETTLGPVATFTIPPGSATNEIVVSGMTAMMTAAGAAGWRLWRSIDGDEFHLIATGAGDTVTDDGSLQVDCISPPTTSGTTNANSKLHVTVPVPQDGAQYRIYVGVDGGFGAQSLLGTYDASQVGVAQVFDTLAFLPGSPPEQSTAMPGLPKITTGELASGGGGGGGALGPLTVWPPLSVRPGTSLSALYAVQWGLADGLAMFGRFYEQADPTYILGGRDTQVYGNAGANDYVPADWLGDTAEFSWDATGVGITDTTGATGADHAVYLPLANAGNELLGQVSYNILANTWDRIFVGAVVSASSWGFVAVIDRVAGKLALCRITNLSPFTYIEVASIGAAEGYTVPVTGDTGFLSFRQVGNHVWVSDSRWLDLVHAEIAINDPITLNPSQGVFGGKWAAVSAVNFDWIAFSEVPTTREIVAAPVAAGVPDESQAVRLWSAAEILQDVGALDNSWTNVVGRHNVAIRRYRGNLEIVGSADGGAAGTSIFTLPPNDHDLWRPTNDTTVIAPTDTGTTAITVHTDGTVTSSAAGPVHMNISIPLV